MSDPIDELIRLRADAKAIMAGFTNLPHAAQIKPEAIEVLCRIFSHLRDPATQQALRDALHKLRMSEYRAGRDGLIDSTVQDAVADRLLAAMGVTK